MREYVDGLRGVLADIEDDVSVDVIVARLDKARTSCARVFFIGNGGSAAIASHMAADWLKNAGFTAMCFNDGALLTCISNDIDYRGVFSLPLGLHARGDDILVAISSSGKSSNILDAVHLANSKKMYVITMSGFEPNNALRGMGTANFYVRAMSYGFVEISHLAICHAILDRFIAVYGRDFELPSAVQHKRVAWLS